MFYFSKGLFDIRISADSHAHLGRSNVRLDLFQLQWSGTKTIVVAEEKDTFAFTNGSLRWFNPLAPAGALPQSSQKAKSSSLNVSAVMAAHNWFDSF